MSVQPALSDVDCDVCVLGAGPAGSVIAVRLAQLGHATVLVERGDVNDDARVESLAPSILSILDSVGLRDPAEAAVLRRERGALLLWGGGAVEEKRFNNEPSLLIERTRFDAMLREAAVTAGSRLMVQAAARTPSRLAAGRWSVAIDTTEGLRTLRTRFLIEARGRGRQGSARQRGVPTAAVSAAWNMGQRCFDETRIEATTNAWAWGSPLPGGCYAVTIFVDAGCVAGLGLARRTEFYRALLARMRVFETLTRSNMISPVRVRDATSGITGDLIGQDFIRVGEAAFAIDPLASQGIQAAILSALQGAAAVHTILTGHNGDAAREFYRGRQEHASAQACRHAAHFYTLCADTTLTQFWKARSLSTPEGPADTARQRQAPNVLPRRLRLSPELSIIEVPVLAGALVERASAIRHPGLAQPVAYLGGFALAPLIADASTASTTEHLLARWSRQMAPKAAQHIATWMYGVGILIEGPA